MAVNSFKISAELLQKNAAKASIRDLNAEFQMKGGSVIYKTSKKGDNYLLSHADDNYLEEFRIRLFKELGLIEEKDVPKEQPEQKSPPPRYGDKHNLRRGWNVRSPREFNEGKYDRGDRRQAEGTPYQPQDRGYQPRPGSGDRPHGRDRPRDDRHGRDRRPSGNHGKGRYDDRRNDRRGYGRDEPAASSPPEDAENIRTFEERWPDAEKYMTIIEDALKEGAVDDGEVIRFAYSKEIPEEDIKQLKKLLWDNRCRGEREKCPHGKKKLRFEDMMKVCSGNVEGWENIDSPLIRFLDIWKGNMEQMYGEFNGKNVIVKGKISSYKSVYRKGHEHLKVLVYDTKVKLQDGDDEMKDTRKFWVKITLKEFHKLLGDTKVHLEDIISLKGKCLYDKYFHDYWIVDLTEMKVLEEGGGEVISPPQE